jgi:hypothetical protein
MKTPAPTANCKLCGNLTTLQWSHIVPRWTYRRVIQTAAGGKLVNVQGDTAIFGGDQYAEYMLGTGCEQRIGRWETYVSGIALQTDDTFPALTAAKPIPGASNGEWTVADASALDVGTIARFASSVVWRASVSKTFGTVSLGETYEEVFRKYLHDDNVPFPDSARLLVELYDPAKGPRIDRVVVAPESMKDPHGYHVHQFCIFGMWYRLLVGRLTPSNIDTFCVVKTGRVLLSDGSRLLQSVAKSALAKTPKGSLAKQYK